MINKTYKKLKLLSKLTTPKELSDKLSFKEGVLLAKNLLNNDEWDDELQGYSANFLEEIRRLHPNEWNSSWKFDAFLGYVYHIILKYDESFLAYKRAFEKVSPPPPQLLIAMARCCRAPGTPPITEDESIELVKQALSDKNYYEGVSLLRGLYKLKGNQKAQDYWEQLLENISEGESSLPSLDDLS